MGTLVMRMYDCSEPAPVAYRFVVVGAAVDPVPQAATPNQMTSPVANWPTKLIVVSLNPEPSCMRFWL